MKEKPNPSARWRRATTPIPKVFEVEKSGLLARTWQFACHASQLENPGDYVAFDLGDESLFSIKGRDGEIRTFYNVCQHRRISLSAAKAATRVVVCPYHAWTYELTGKLRAAPNAKSVPGFDAAKICLTEVRTEVFLGFVFVNLDPDAAPMDDWFPNARRVGRVRAQLGRSETAGMGGDPRELQLEGLGRELLRMLPLHPEPPDLRHRRDPAGNL